MIEFTEANVDIRNFEEPCDVCGQRADLQNEFGATGKKWTWCAACALEWVERFEVLCAALRDKGVQRVLGRTRLRVVQDEDDGSDGNDAA